MAEVEEVVSKPASENNEEPKLDSLGRAYSTGKRKDAVARVWIKEGSGQITVNKKPVDKYFARPTLQMIIQQAFSVCNVDKQFDVIVKLRVDSKSKNTNNVLFVLELDYGGVFQIENIPDEQLHPYLLIECPRMLFPFLRRIVSDVTRDGGFPPLNLENIDFLKLYRQEIAVSYTHLTLPTSDLV